MFAGFRFVRTWARRPCRACPPARVARASRPWAWSKHGRALALLAFAGLATSGVRAVNISDQKLVVDVKELASPAVAGSLGAALAQGPDGTVFLAWMERAGTRGTALKFAALDAYRRSWSEPRLIAQGPDLWGRCRQHPGARGAGGGPDAGGLARRGLCCQQEFHSHRRRTPGLEPIRQRRCDLERAAAAFARERRHGVCCGDTARRRTVSGGVARQTRTGRRSAAAFCSHRRPRRPGPARGSERM